MLNVVNVHKNSMLTHIVAALLALLYAWAISQSAYVKTGIQFISPLLVIITVHLIWLAFCDELKRGFSMIVLTRCAQTATVLAIVVAISSVITPTPAQANAGELIAAVLGVLFCLAVLAALVAILAFAILLIFKLGRVILRKLRGSNDDGSQTRFYDVASMILVMTVLGIASLEGVTNAFSFATRNSTTATRLINAPDEQVWDTMETATSPQFALPKFLQIFPQPVDVVIDQGTSLGALRQVAFRGREGAGDLTLRVVTRTDDRAVFAVLSDTSPIANWVSHRFITYHVNPVPNGTVLNVTLEFDRELAPSWFFTPLTNVAGYFAMDVLARDVKIRSENRL